MKTISNLRNQVFFFSLLFTSGMWMSKVAQPLYFESNGAMVAFGAGYAAMALVGGLSVAWGYLADRIGGLNAVRIGALVYAAGISGRVFTEVLPTIAFSIVAGAGASLALVGLRPWIRSRANDKDIPKIVALRNVGNQSGVFIGTLGAASIFALSTNANTGQQAALLVAPALVLFGATWVSFTGRNTTYIADKKQEAIEAPKVNTRVLVVKLTVLGMISGFYVSLVAPYVPLIFRNVGMADAGIAVAISVTSLAQIVSTAVLTKLEISSHPYRLFIISETSTAILTLLALLSLELPSLIIVIIFVVRSAFLAIAATTEEIIQFSVIPTAAVGFVFGAYQTAFLIGDATGGALGALLWNMYGPWGLLGTAAVITALNSILLPLFLKKHRIAA